MKSKSFIIFTLACLFHFEGNVWAQEGSAGDDTTKVSSQFYPPFYLGGEKALSMFIKKTLSYPPLLGQIEGEGECVMHFTVEEDGTISNISATDCRVTHYNTGKLDRYSPAQQTEMLKDCAKSMAKEGYRLIRKMKKWHPAVNNNMPVSLDFSLPLHFSMNYIDD